MVLDMDVWRSAASMVKIHGDVAPMACAELVEKWERRGDEVAARNWRRIMDAARTLADSAPKPS
jgi:hypothetical protein